ncbi:unnamed protein product [Cylindrotheca closterium]|uniref:Uncharacterized protein n=1 Tax=Cylindrotheca closterium TaxID=2856 RepID=A0AAD2JIK9_9STRA|nr:unnamed protein product [Cylindrotheca closterium]
MEDDSNTSTVSTTPRTSATVTLNPPTTLPLTQSITRDSWCSEWMSLCKSRGLPWNNNHRRWAAPAAPLLELPEVLVTTSTHSEGSYAEFEDMEWKAYCSLAAVARMEEDDDAAVSTEVTACGPPLALKLSIHCSLPHTGIGSALFLNGQDAALIRASSIVDATGQVVLHMVNSQNVSFAILSGPGEIQGSVRQSKIIGSQQCSVAHCTTWIGPSGSPCASLSEYEKARLQAINGILPVATMVRGEGSYAEFEDVEWKAGSLAAVARMEEDGDAVAFTELMNCGAPVSINCPPPHIGSGSTLFLDGQDAALIQASIVDATGQNSQKVSFVIVSGPGEIQGSGSGNSKPSNNTPWHIAYHGLVRAVVL